MGRALRQAVGKLSSTFPLNVLFNHNAEHVCHKERKKSHYPVQGCMWLLLYAITQNLRTDLSSWEADSALQALDRLSKIQMQLIFLITTWNRICVQEETVALRTATSILEDTGAMCRHQACST